MLAPLGLTSTSLPIALAFLAGAAGALVTLALVAWARRRWIAVVVAGSSMSPTLRDGERLLAHRVRSADGAQYRHGDIVVFRAAPDLTARRTDRPSYRVKRIVALAGDPLPSWARTAGASELVPRGSVLVHGDNRAASESSREFGPIDVRSIVAIVRRVREAIAEPTRAG
jgi:signal peptidase I